MSEFNIEVQGGSSVRLPTAGKYCEQDIIVTASGGGDSSELENLIDASEVLGTFEGTATEKVEQLIDKAQWEKFWYEQSGRWSGQFPSGLFVGATTIPRLNYENVTLMRSSFASSLVESIDYYINCGKAYEISRTFQNCSNIKFLYGIDMSNCENCEYVFGGCVVLDTIQEPLNFLKVTRNGGCFNNCNALKDVRFVPETIKVSTTIPSPVLSVDSAKSIILGLKNYSNDDTNGFSNTLTLPQEVWAKLDAEEGIQAPDGIIVSWRIYVEMYLWWNT